MFALNKSKERFHLAPVHNKSNARTSREQLRNLLKMQLNTQGVDATCSSFIAVLSMDQ